jgi:hypothetical protein
MADKYMKICSIASAIKEMQIKTTLNFPLSPVRMAIMKKTVTNVVKDARKGRNPHILLVGM